MQDCKMREYNIDLLRILCCFLIVQLHFSSSYWFAVELGSYDFIVMTIYNAITRVAVPIFIMISGCYLLDPGRLLDTKKLMSRPMRLLGTVYLWSAFYAFQGLIIDYLRYGQVSSERWGNSITRFINGHYHMWFCFLVIGYYLLLPVARKIAEDKKVLSIFLLLWVIFAYAIPCVFSWIDMPGVVYYFEKFEINLIRGYFGYFLLGYYIRKVEFYKKTRIAIYFVGVASMCLTIVLSLLQSKSSGERVETWFSPSSPFILLSSFALFLFFKNLKIDLNKRTAQRVVSLSGFTFFIYMFHVFILEKMNMLGITTLSFDTLLSVPILSVLAFVISAILAWGLHKIPIINKVLLYM